MLNDRKPIIIVSAQFRTPIQAIAFENEVLLESWKASIEVHQALLGKQLEENVLLRILQEIPLDACTTLLAHYHSKERIEEYWFRYEQAIQMKNPTASLKVGAVSIMEKLHEKSIGTIVCADVRRTAFLMGSTYHDDLYSLVDIVLTRESFSAKKPDPQYYLSVLKTVGLTDPKSVLVFTSTPIGVAAAKNAGMPVVYIPEVPNAVFDDSEDVLRLRSLDEFNFDFFAWNPIRED